MVEVAAAAPEGEDEVALVGVAVHPQLGVGLGVGHEGQGARPHRQLPAHHLLPEPLPQLELLSVRKVAISQGLDGRVNVR